jgi:hypothetical protein
LPLQMSFAIPSWGGSSKRMKAKPDAAAAVPPMPQEAG